ncbi:hypothetical protein L9F63_009876, partial [Diploptera punctata]
IFGNLETKHSSRQTLILEARTHIEVLAIKTEIFYDLLNRYPIFLHQFNKIIAINQDFVMPLMSQQEILKQEMEDEVGSQSYSQSYSQLSASLSFRSSKSAVINVLKKHKVFLGSKTGFEFWNVLLFVCGAYVNYILTLYQAGTHEFHVSVLVIQYFIDILYFFKIYMRFHTAYEDEYGENITDLRLIANRYLHEKCGLFLDILTLLPFECISFAFGSFGSAVFLKAYVLFRLNRLGRIYKMVLSVLIKENKTQDLPCPGRLKLWDVENVHQVMEENLRKSPCRIPEELRTSKYSNTL